MTPEQQRIAIAEACGWQKGIWAADCYSGEGWLSPGKTQEDALHQADLVAWRESELPDYLDDLNEMHEAEKTLDNRQCQTYALWLLRFTQTGDSLVPSTLCAVAFLWHVPASKRAEAFLRTIGKWLD